MPRDSVGRWRVALRVLAWWVVGACAPISAQTPRPQLTAEEWRADLDTMVAQQRERHWDLFHTVSPEVFHGAVDRLKQEVDDLERHEILVEIARLLALVGDGHTRFWLNRFEETGFHQFPVRLYRFADGWYVRSVDDRHGWAAGSRVLAVGEVPIEEAFGRVAEVVSQDNPRTALAVAPAYLVIPEVLHALDVIPDPTRATFRLEVEGGGSRELTLEGSPARCSRALTSTTTRRGSPTIPIPRAGACGSWTRWPAIPRSGWRPRPRTSFSATFPAATRSTSASPA